ncbi:hypothetical protein VaNZ11_006193 [Volvox africanus]|uniref:Peptidase S54 rhomboid domain-containing protein n=1 Tax=Volvox africanus TaxID=51714 RepID=A0ABQ5S088_9CHLO|nr:hypothetical protein VaNZ11_006193 [Volvox africanus]
METRKRCTQLVLRCLSNPERCHGVPHGVNADNNQSYTATNSAHYQDPQYSVEAQPRISNSSPFRSPWGLGVLAKPVGCGGSHFVGRSQTWSASRVQHMSWRRYLPSMNDLSNAAGSPDRQVTNLLLAINCATYILTHFDHSVAANMALIPYQVTRGEWYRLFTCGFLHLDFLHLLANMLSLHWLGPGVESAAGRGRFTAIYVTSVMGGGLAQYHFGSFATASFGASGGVFGLFAAYLMYRLRNRHFIEWDRGDTSWLMQVVAINMVLGFMAGGYISQMAHLGGAVAGAASCWLIGPRYRWEYGRVVDKPLLPMFRTRD